MFVDFQLRCESWLANGGRMGVEGFWKKRGPHRRCETVMNMIYLTCVSLYYMTNITNVNTPTMLQAQTLRQFMAFAGAQNNNTNLLKHILLQNIKRFGCVLCVDFSYK